MEPLKILIIDDSAGTRNLLQTILEMEDFQVSSVGEIEQGDIIAVLDQHTPDFLILDYHLKGEETLEYVKTIRHSATWKDVGILMISAIDLEKNCLRAGANGFMVKPFEWHEIVSAIRKISSEI